MARLRLCLAVECTGKAGSLWPTTLQHVVEPLLALAEASSAGGAAPGLQLALVLFGALPPHSGAAVESVLGWSASVQHLRRLLDSLEFVGGGGRQPVMLAHALAEAAALFAAADAADAGGGGPWQQHCLVCLASEPAVQPVSWPFAEDCCMVGDGGRTGWVVCCRGRAAWPGCLPAGSAVGCMLTASTSPALPRTFSAPLPRLSHLFAQARLPGMATSLELVRALRRRGVQLSLAGGDMLSNELTLLHLANCVSDVPYRCAGACYGGRGNDAQRCCHVRARAVGIQQAHLGGSCPLGHPSPTICIHPVPPPPLAGWHPAHLGWLD